MNRVLHISAKDVLSRGTEQRATIMNAKAVIGKEFGAEVSLLECQVNRMSASCETIHRKCGMIMGCIGKWDFSSCNSGAPSNGASPAKKFLVRLVALR